MRLTIRDEDHLWSIIAPRLLGKWWRLEAIVPDGLPDAFGLWNGQTWWCEQKIGKPSLKLLRPNQREFGYDCIKRGVPIYTCVGYRGAPLFFKNFAFGQPIVPPWYQGP